ncbi:hypothetical protein DOD22_2582 [Staphylococcus arlettae]|jgi:hypothetical protein|nr:hypothetical protein DOD22_2582 [Staphylococcus arlettae]SCS27833.1 Uncharacterised protein [Staphylococcus aureus]SCT45419.1 Uncharacterised protein [Staphylococcus cohnii subsp. cohnii]
MLHAFIFGVIPMLVLIAIAKIGQIIKQRQKR